MRASARVGRERPGLRGEGERRKRRRRVGWCYNVIILLTFRLCFCKSLVTTTTEEEEEEEEEKRDCRFSDLTGPPLMSRSVADSLFFWVNCVLWCVLRTAPNSTTDGSFRSPFTVSILYQHRHTHSCTVPHSWTRSHEDELINVRLAALLHYIKVSE